MKFDSQDFTRRFKAAIPAAVVVALFTTWRYYRPAPKIVPVAPVPFPSPEVSAARVPSAESSSRPQVPPGETNVDGTVQGASAQFRWASVWSSEYGLKVSLSSEGVRSCERSNPQGDGYDIEFEIPPGPGGTYYAGSEIGLRVDVRGRGLGYAGSTWMRPSEVRVTLEPFRVAVGAKIRGTLDLRDTSRARDGGPTEIHASGSFVAEICSIPSGGRWAGLPTVAPARNVSGRIGKKDISPRSAIAWVAKSDADDAPYISQIRFYEQSGPTCAQGQDNDFIFAGHTLYVEDIGGASKRRPVLHALLPATGGIFTSDGEALWFSARRHAWVRLDEVSFVPGGVVRGELWSESWPDEAIQEGRGSFGGRFEAKVCAF